MTPAEFDEGFAELCSYYGEKSYAPKMITMIQSIVRPLTKSEFLQVVEALAQTHHKTPPPAMIKQASLPFLQRAYERERQARIAELNAGALCEVCGNSGVVTALLKKDPGLEFTFGCPYCQAYRARRLRHPAMWNDDLKAKFIPVSMRRESYEAGMKLKNDAFKKYHRPETADRPAEGDVRQSIQSLVRLIGQRREDP